MFISEIKLSGIGTFAEETVIVLDSETFFCGNSNSAKTFKRAMELLFGGTSPAPQDFSANELKISAKFSFPDTNSAEIPEFFHHMRSDESGDICAVLELAATLSDGVIDTQLNWLIAHGVRRSVKAHELSEIKFIRIAPQKDALKKAFLQLATDILQIEEDITLPNFPETASLINAAKVFENDCSEWLFNGIEKVVAEEKLPELLEEMLAVYQTTLKESAVLLLYIEDMPRFNFNAEKSEVIYYATELPEKDLQLEKVRCFTKNSVLNIPLPENDADKISLLGGIRNFPELLSADAVIFTVSADDIIILDKFFKISAWESSSLNIAKVPLSGRKLHIFWQLLDKLNIPYFTLADLRSGEPYGDWAMITRYLHACVYCGKALPVEEGKDEAVNINELSEYTPDLKNENVWLAWLQEHRNIFFAAPFDLNYLMIQSFRSEYNEIFPEYNGTDEEFYRQISSRRDYSAVHAEIFSILSDDELRKRMPELLRTLINRIK